MAKISSLCVFGDSTAWGAWDLEQGGWVTRLWKYIGNRPDDRYIEMYNLSISGGTSSTLLSRFAAEAKAREADALLFQTGINDAAFDHDANTVLVSEELYQKNLTDIIEQAQKITSHIAFIGLRNCDETRTTPVPWRNISYTNEALEKYQRVLQVICQQYDIPLLAVQQLSAQELYDGIHPNSDGHQQIFLQVQKFLEHLQWV